jgi:hypothetical protein
MTLGASSIVWTVCVITALVGCASSPERREAQPTSTAPRPAAAILAELPPEVARQGELSVMLADKLRGASSCADVGRELERFTQNHRAELKETQAALVRWEKGASEHELKVYYRRVFPAIEVRIDAGIRCKDHRAARLAFDRFFAATGLDQASH